MSQFPNSTRISDLTATDLVKRVERLPTEALHELPFGVIRLNAERQVVFFSRTEAAQSGYGDRVAIGRMFFTELAPCIATEDFLARVERALSAGTLDLTFEHTGDFNDADREITIRVASATGGGMWLFLQRHG